MKNLKILAYHSIGSNSRDILSVKPESFEKQILFFLKRNWRCLTLKDLYNQYILPQKELSGKTFIITLDDGYKDNYLYAFPILKKYHLRATIFLVVDFIGKADFLNWEEIFKMQNYGIEFGSHALFHRELTKVSLPEAEKEIFDSKRILEEKLKTETISFCYPMGDFNEEVTRLVERAGYKLAVVTPCKSGIKESNFTLKRIGISLKDNNLRFKFKISKFFNLVKETKFKIT